MDISGNMGGLVFLGSVFFMTIGMLDYRMPDEKFTRFETFAGIHLMMLGGAVLFHFAVFEKQLDLSLLNYSSQLIFFLIGRFALGRFLP